MTKNIFIFIGLLLFSTACNKVNVNNNEQGSLQKQTITGTIQAQDDLGIFVTTVPDNKVYTYGLYIQEGQKVRKLINEKNEELKKDNKQLYMVPFKTIDGEYIIIHFAEDLNNPLELKPHSIKNIKIKEDLGKIYYLLDHTITYRGYETTYGRKNFQLILPSYIVEFIEE